VAGAIGVSTTLYGAAVLFALLLCAVLAVRRCATSHRDPALRPAGAAGAADPLAAARAGVQEVPSPWRRSRTNAAGQSAALTA